MLKYVGYIINYGDEFEFEVADGEDANEVFARTAVANSEMWYGLKEFNEDKLNEALRGDGNERS